MPLKIGYHHGVTDTMAMVAKHKATDAYIQERELVYSETRKRDNPNAGIKWNRKKRFQQVAQNERCGCP